MRRIVAQLRVVYDRYNELDGRATAAAITLYGFLSLFAITLLAVAIVGFVSADNNNVAADIVNWLGVKGAAAKTVTDAVDKAQESRRVASIVGVVGLVWTGSSFAVAIANAYDVAWRVPHRVARERLIGLAWLAGAGLLLTAGGFVTALFETLPVAVVPLVLLGSIAVDTLVWLSTSWLLPNRRVPWRALLPAALVGAVGLEILKVAGGIVVPRLVARSSALYGTIGVVFALLAWLLILGRLVVVVSVLEVVGWEREHGTEQHLVIGPALPEADGR